MSCSKIAFLCFDPMKAFRYLPHYLIILILSFFQSCTDSETLFEILPSEQTSIDFVNTIHESDSFNLMTSDYIYNGAGIGIADFNNDGLQDIFFAGNHVSNKLYLNKGGLAFNDVSVVARILAPNSWCTGVAIADINTDGWQDIYVSTANFGGMPEYSNLLYINKGLNANGVPVFEEVAKNYGIDDKHQVMHSVFIDYDKDSDLDLFVIVNVAQQTAALRRSKVSDGSSETNNILYRNNGDETFTDVTTEAGVLHEGFSLDVCVSDINQDGWPDLYVSNDFAANDLLYMNQKDGTFKNEIAQYLKHQCLSAMGLDIADLNNDGWQDIVVLDMLPESNVERKKMLHASNYKAYAQDKFYGYEHQYIRNVMQINNGISPDGEQNFSEIGLMTGIYATGWSWSPLIADYDNDGFNDIFISNGFPGDVVNLDFDNIRRMMGFYVSPDEVQKVLQTIRISNYAYQNNGSLSFVNSTKKWGLERPSYSNAAVYVDLDNDGDLDLVMSSFDEPALVYENTLNSADELGSHSIRVKLNGSESLPQTFGTKIHIYSSSSDNQFKEQSPYRGFMSSLDPVIHFGLGDTEVLDSMVITWPDDRQYILYGVKADQVLELTHDTNSDLLRKQVLSKTNPEPIPFLKANDSTGLLFQHKEIDFIDFDVQPLIPHKFSQYGPSLTVSDVDNNGEFDLFIGGPYTQNGTLFLQENGKFTGKQLELDKGKEMEDGGSLFFDADNDGDQDLYIVSGGFEKMLNPKQHTDRLYLNDGSGNFSKSVGSLPDFLVSGSCVKGADYDRDGDIDLFIGGLISPWEYPKPVSSYILRNDTKDGKAKFTNVGSEVCPRLENIGLVKDALWTDFDNDGLIDLIVVGEWMPITIFRNTGESFEDITTTGLSDKYGWWNSITGGDFDNDGDTDYVVGNLGLNSFYQASNEYPVVCYSGDFDGKGTYDLVLGTFQVDEFGEKQLYPVHSKLDLERQLPDMAAKFPTYGDYSVVKLDDLLPAEKPDQPLKLEVTWLQNSYLENLGNGSFAINPLPIETQVSPIFGVLPMDVDNDQNLDMIVIGNDHGNNVFWGHYDASNGFYLRGDGVGNFQVKPYSESGFLVDGDAKALVHLPTQEGLDLIVASQNQDSLKSFFMVPTTDFEQPTKTMTLKDNDAYAIVTLTDGSIRKIEFYYGDTWFSQSARVLRIPSSAQEIKIYSFDGEVREL